MKIAGVKLANWVTASRLLLAPFFLVAFVGYGDEPAGRWWALGLALYFEITDMVDGTVARQLQQTSTLGKVMDPLADSISRFTIFLGFLQMDFAHTWAIAAIFYRDSIVSFIRVVGASQGVIVSARITGKLKAIMQGGAIVIILGVSCFREELGVSDLVLREELSKPVMDLVAVVTLLSLLDYLLGNRAVLAELDA